jgi:hypothetical protein
MAPIAKHAILAANAIEEWLPAIRPELSDA